MSKEPPQNNPFLTQLLDASADGILAFDRDFRYIAWNPAMERISGLKRADVLGKRAFDLFPFIKETGEDKCLYAALAGQTSSSENRPYVIPETGRAGFFQGHYSPLHNEQNEVVGGIAVIVDITERKRVEEAAQEAHKRLTFHVENTPLAVIEWDSDARVSRWSDAAERLFGWTEAEVLGKHVGDWHFVFEDDIDAVAQVTHRQRAGSESIGMQSNRNFTKDGHVLFCEWYNSVLHDKHGNMVSVLSLVLDVTARTLAERERAGLLAQERDLRKQAEVADRLKDEFLATLSHELRTPLTSILGWATLIRNGEVDKAENLDRALEIIERNARSQARLIDDLLDVSRIITGNLQLEVHPLNVAPIVDAAIEALRPAADAKGIQIVTELDPQTCLVSGDANRLRQVIWNLLMNAIKFTPRSGKVVLQLACFAERERGTGNGGTGNSDEAPIPSSFPLPVPLLPGSPIGPFVRLTVSDTGDGISPEFLPYVFHRFRQEEGSISRKAGGLGLGLAVVRHLVELHGGSVSAESGGPGMGSTFTVDLPLAAERRSTVRSAVVDHNDFERRRTDRNNGSTPAQTSEVAAADENRPASATDELPLVSVRVLLVEDDDDSRDLLSLVLSRHGAEVIGVASSAAALDSFTQRAPDVVISDIAMADEDGYALIRKLRALPVQGSLLPESLVDSLESTVGSQRSVDSSLSTHHSSLGSGDHSSLRHVPAIALTGYATAKDKERALAAGYQLHMAKPVEPEDLVAAIIDLVNG
ncbi:MAG TPA: PAS domain S-box protein [Pyrinomonadaceae bacterium]|nr:PAS domain S-box protein [Pyrinomonadaceae bacterium]